MAQQFNKFLGQNFELIEKLGQFKQQLPRISGEIEEDNKLFVQMCGQFWGGLSETQKAITFALGAGAGIYASSLLLSEAILHSTRAYHNVTYEEILKEQARIVSEGQQQQEDALPEDR